MTELSLWVPLKENKELSTARKIWLELPKFLSGYKKRIVPTECILGGSVCQKWNWVLISHPLSWACSTIRSMKNKSVKMICRIWFFKEKAKFILQARRDKLKGTNVWKNGLWTVDKESSHHCHYFRSITNMVYQNNDIQFWTVLSDKQEDKWNRGS